MLVIWNCDMGKDCANTNEPGLHRGDFGYDDMRECRGIPRPEKEMYTEPILVIGEHVPNLIGQLLDELPIGA